MIIIILSLFIFVSIVFLIDVLISIAILNNDDPLLYRAATVHKRWNKIDQCDSCKKLSRVYQRKIYAEINDRGRCPHCENYMYGWKIETIKEEKWMKIHPDCPKVSLLECFKIYKTIKKIRKNKKLIKSQQFFEEYNNIEVDLSWIENLQKNHK